MIEAAHFEVVKVGPSLAERIEKQRAVTARTLKRFRERLEHGSDGESWAAMEIPAGLMLADVCDALGLDPGQRREVLGDAGTAFVAKLEGERVMEVENG